MRIPVLALVLALAALAAFAQKAPQPADPAARYGAIIGISDSIVLGAYGDVTMPELPTTYNAGSASSPWGGGATPVATVKLVVEKALKGDVKGGDVVTVAVPLRAEYSRGAAVGAPVAITWTPKLSPGDRAVLFLKRSPTGLELTNRYNAVAPADDAGVLAGLIKDFSLVVTATAKVPYLGFGAETKLDVTITNRGKESLTLAGLTCEAFYVSDRIENTANLTRVSDTFGAAPATMHREMVLDGGGNMKIGFTAADGALVPPVPGAAPAAKEIKPGETVNGQLVVSLVGPSNWKVFDPKVFPVDLVARVTASARTTPADPKTTRINFVSAASGWMTFLAGPPPAA